MSLFNVLRTADIRIATSCIHDNRKGYAVSWSENDEFNGYELLSGATSPVVWDGVLTFVSTSGTCSIAPTTDQVPVDASVYNFIRVKYRIDLRDNATVPTTGKIQFQTDDEPTYSADKEIEFDVTADNAYHEYLIDASQVKKWVGNVKRIRLFPFIDGPAAGGVLIHLKKIEVESDTNFACDTSYNGAICNRYSQYVHPCPWVGRGGSCSSDTLSDLVSIEKGVNDYLLVDINSYGPQGITLKEGTFRLEEVAYDLEEKLSSVAIGGYYGCKVVVEDNKLKITADDTREASSTVVVLDTSAARTLKFFDGQGNSLQNSSSGEEAADRYESVSSLRMSRTEVSRLYRDNPSTEGTHFELYPRGYTVEAGREDYDSVYRDQKIDASDATIIDFNNPISNTGRITNVYYSGDGNSTTEFKLIRPKADGSYEVVTSINMGIPTDGTLDRVFSKAVDIKVRKGDLVAFFDVKVHSGKKEEFPNTSYFLYPGNLTGTVSGLQQKGRGERGLRVYARGQTLAEEVVLDIEFQKDQPLEEIKIVAQEEERVEIYNLSRVRSGGQNGGPYVTGATGSDKNGSQAPSMTGLEAITDTVKRAGVGTTPSARPSWAGTVYTPSDLYDQTPFSITLDFARGVPVFYDIYRAVVYFRDEDNVKFFSLQYPVTTDATDTNIYWDFVGESYDKVYLEGRLLEPSDHPLYTIPLQPTASEFQDSYQFLRYRKLDLEFAPVRARSLRFEVKNYNYITDITSASYSDFEIAPSPYILEIEVYAKSTPRTSIADNFYFESSLDGDNYYLHTSSKVISENEASYLIGYPTKYLRMHIKPESLLRVFGTEITLSANQEFASGKEVGVVNPGYPTSSFDEVKVVSVRNDSSETSNFYVDLVDTKSDKERCILWNKLSSDSEVSRSRLGSGAVVVKREPFYLRETNYAYNTPAYVVDPNWLLNKKCYVTYNQGGSYTALGGLFTDYNVNTYLRSTNLQLNEGTVIYLLVDLGARYALDTTQVVNDSPYLSPFNISYSNSEVSNPQSLDIVNDFFGTKAEARWIRMTMTATNPIRPPSQTYSLSYLRISLDCFSAVNRGKIPWIAAPKLVNAITKSTTDGASCGEGWQCPISGFTNYYAIDLQGRYDISNVIVGPSSALSSATNVDTLEPGGVGSLFAESSFSNANLTFSSDDVSDPARVLWRSAGNAVSGRDRWLLLKRTTFADELMVHVDGNEAADKNPPHQPRWWTTSVTSASRDFFNFREGDSSISFIYPTNSSSVEELLFRQTLGEDGELGKRDSLRILFHISDVTQLDVASTVFSIGRNTTEINTGANQALTKEMDSENYYQWSLGDLTGLSLSSGWNELLLPFTDNFKVGEPYFTKDYTVQNTNGKLTKRSRFTWFKCSFRGVSGNKQFSVNLGGFNIVRTKYTPSKFGNGLYLTGSDYAKFRVDNFDVFQGTVQFWINPDWSKVPGCNSCQDPNEHTIFRFFNDDGFVLAGFMTGKGLRIYLSNGVKHFFLTDATTKEILPFEDSHIAVTWDLKSRYSKDALRVYINGEFSSSFEAVGLGDSEFSQNSSVNLMLGGIGWDGVINPRSSAVDGSIHDLRVHTYPMSDFTDGLTGEYPKQDANPASRVEVSLDGVNYYSIEDRGNGLPMLKAGVLSKQSFPIYIRNKEGGPSISEVSSVAFIEVIRTRNGL